MQARAEKRRWKKRLAIKEKKDEKENYQPYKLKSDKCYQ